MEKISTIELFDGTIATIKDTEKYKVLKSKDYNFFFNKKDGFFVRWGHNDVGILANGGLGDPDPFGGPLFPRSDLLVTHGIGSTIAVAAIYVASYTRIERSV